MDRLEHIEGLHTDAPEQQPESGSPIFLRLCLRMRNIRGLIADIDPEDWMIVASQQERHLTSLVSLTTLTADEWQTLYNILHGKNQDARAPIFAPHFPSADYVPPPRAA